ncbi:MAG TPA: GNAT family N-acetyltransferase [Thermomicrobiales bacterium]|jgi:GNAT superfamily N-acetyltransferase|nr:GNAT family N-acetyltransferase [Thermomicrobiales bacterium]
MDRSKPATAGRSRAETLRIVRGALATDCACSEAALAADGVLVTAAEARPGQRRFSPPAKPLLIVTMGAGVVASCHSSRIAWLRALLDNAGRDAIFAAPIVAELANAVARDGQTLRGPDLKLVCASPMFRPAAEPAGVAISLVEKPAVADLYDEDGFENALSRRLDVAAAVAQRGTEIVGIAGASADCDVMWQIGVDVVPVARGIGVGKALVSRLTAHIFAAGRVPYYSAAVANIRSLALATGLGYWPAWTELHVTEGVGGRGSAVEKASGETRDTRVILSLSKDLVTQGPKRRDASTSSA